MYKNGFHNLKPGESVKAIKKKAVARSFFTRPSHTSCHTGLMGRKNRSVYILLWERYLYIFKGFIRQRLIMFLFIFHKIDTLISKRQFINQTPLGLIQSKSECLKYFYLYNVIRRKKNKPRNTCGKTFSVAEARNALIPWGRETTNKKYKFSKWKTWIFNVI